MAEASAAPIKKLEGYEFYRQVLGSPKYVVAPMVDQSELAWRVLSRRYKSDLIYTPMLNAGLFSRDAHYREEFFSTCPEDRPLIVQFCANNPDTLLAAAKYVEDKCDAIDINLGCPQGIAKRGHYGSFLMEDWDLIESMVKKLHTECKVPVTCKIRMYPDDNDKTVRYAQMIEKAGAQLITIHGRTREMKGHNTGLADWDVIKLVKETVNVPVFSNGNILYFDDVERCMRHTGVDGVMTAETNLANPALFTGLHYPVWKLVDEYLEICRTYTTSVGMIRSHLFRLYHASLPYHPDLRTLLASCKNLDAVVEMANQLNDRLKKTAREQMGDNADIEAPYSPDHTNVFNTGHAVVSAIRNFPHWVIQPHTRPLDEIPETKRKYDEKDNISETQVKTVKLDMEAVRKERIERKLRKKEKYRDEKFRKKMCVRCITNTPGKGCTHVMCKNCCVHYNVNLPEGNCAAHHGSIVHARVAGLAAYPLIDPPALDSGVNTEGSEAEKVVGNVTN